jgi:uncharacterized coiled-coil protein SlyX
VSALSDILDRLSGVSQLKERIALQDRTLERMQSLMLEQQRELAELKGMVRALVSIQRPGEKR